MGGEAWQLTKSETDVDGFHWSKDSKSIAFTANPPESKVSKDRKEKYSDYDVYEKDYQQSQLWMADVGAASKELLPTKAKRLTNDSTLNVNSFAWSPDSTRIAFSATKNPLLAFSGEEDIYLLELSSNNSVKKIVALPGPDSSPMFSPDGKQLAFGTSLGQQYFYYTNAHIAVVDLAAVLAKPATTAADARDLTGKFDEDAQPVDWGPDGIYFAAEQKTNAHIYRVNPGTLEIQRITSPDTLLIEDGSFTKDFKTAAFITEDPTHMTELYVSATQPFAPRKLTDVTAQVKDWKLGTVEVVSWKSQGGATIEGILHKPADYDASRKYPLLVMIHGGPTGTSQPTLSPDEYAYPVQVFLSKGAVVLGAELSRQRGIWFGVSRVERAKFRRGRHVGCDERSGCDDRERDRRSEQAGIDGLVGRRIYLGVSDDAHRPVQGDFGGSGNQRLDDVLRQHGYHAVHTAIFACNAVGRSRGLCEDFADHDHQASQNADADSAGKQRQARAGAGQFRVVSGLAGSGSAGAIDSLHRIWTRSEQAEIAPRAVAGESRLVQFLYLGRSHSEGFAVVWGQRAGKREVTDAIASMIQKASA